MIYVLLVVVTLTCNVAAAVTCWGEHNWITVFCSLQAITNCIVLVAKYYESQAVRPLKEKP
jgi:hypothetical protein